MTRSRRRTSSTSSPSWEGVLLHLRGTPWARIAEFVGQRDLAVTANVYSHVMVDETELDYDTLPAKS